MAHLSLVDMHRRRLGSSQTLDRRCSRSIGAYVPGCVPRAGHQLLIRPSYRVLERHGRSRLLLMARLSLVHMHIRRFDSSQTFDSRCSRIVVEYVPSDVAQGRATSYSFGRHNVYWNVTIGLDSRSWPI